MTDVRSVAANATVDNVISGKLHEFLQRPSIVRVLSTASAVGLKVSLTLGSEIVIQDQETSGANRFPIYPDDQVAETAGFRGDRIVISVRNTTGLAVTSNIVVDVIPAA